MVTERESLPTSRLMEAKSWKPVEVRSTTPALQRRAVRDVTLPLGAVTVTMMRFRPVSVAEVRVVSSTGLTTPPTLEMMPPSAPPVPPVAPRKLLTGR